MFLNLISRFTNRMLTVLLVFSRTNHNHMVHNIIISKKQGSYKSDGMSAVFFFFYPMCVVAIIGYLFVFPLFGFF